MSEVALSHWWGFKLSGRLAYVACAGELVLLCALALDESLSWVGWAAAGMAVLVLLVMRWPYGALFVLIGASVMPRFFVEIFGWKARPEHFAVTLVSLAVFISWWRARSKLQLETPDYWVLAYVAANYFSSGFGSSSPSDTLRWALLNNLAVLPYFLVRFFVRDSETLRKAIRIFLGIAVAESMYGISCYALHHMFGTMVGMDLAYFVDTAAPYGTLSEPNLFGAYVGTAAVLALAIYLLGERRLGYLICFFVASVAVVLSLSRAALIATVMAVGWVYWQGRHSRMQYRKRSATLVLAVGLILLIVIPAAGDVVQQRFKDLVEQGLTEGTAVGRFVESYEALQEFSEHRLIGTGTASFQLSFDWGKYLPDLQGRPTWVGNVTVRILHDTGVVGMAVILGLLISLVWKIRPISRTRTSQTPALVGLSAGALLYAISFQATDATLQTFCWIHLGILTSAALIAHHSAHGTNRIAGV